MADKKKYCCHSQLTILEKERMIIYSVSNARYYIMFISAQLPTCKCYEILLRIILYIVYTRISHRMSCEKSQKNCLHLQIFPIDHDGTTSPVHLDLENDLIQSLYFFSKIQKKIQVLADPVVVNFFEMYLIQHL